MTILPHNEMQGLIFMHGITSEPYTTADVISKSTGVSRHAVMQLINTHKQQLEAFGILAFEMRKITVGRGRPTKVWQLNENQATLLITMLDNTPAVVEFKSQLVKAFFAQRQEIQKWHQERLLNRETNKTMAQVIHDIWPDSKHQYTNFHNLAWRVAIGYTASQFAKASGVKDAIKALIIIGHDYQKVKASLTRRVA